MLLGHTIGSLFHGETLGGRVDVADFGVHAVIQRHFGDSEGSNLGIHPAVGRGGGAGVHQTLLGRLHAEVIDASGIAGDKAGEDGPDEPPGLPQREQGGYDCGTQAPDDGEDYPKPAHMAWVPLHKFLRPGASTKLPGQA